eukprot:11658583-Ditylum_brightwellii.AAC.1
MASSLCCLTLFCLFPPLSGVKMVTGCGGCFGGAGQLSESLLLPYMNGAVHKWHLPPGIHSFC